MKPIPISIILVVVFIGGAIALGRSGKKSGAETQNNISIVNGKQIIAISAKGGYSPKNTIAKANLPTVIKVNTNGTFDCSSAVSIPSLGYRANLPPSGDTLIEVSPQPSGSTLQGLCAMAMYNFTIRFD